MSRRSPVGLLLAGLALSVLPGGTFAQSPAASGLEGVDWQLVRIAGSGVPFIDVPPDVDATLRIDGAQAGGQGGCNSWFSDVKVDGDAVVFGDIGATMMACEEPGMSFEGQYLGYLADVQRWAIVDGGLELADGAGAVLLVFAAPGEAAPLEGVDWRVTSLLIDGAMTDLPPDVDVTIRLEAGQASGVAGCNSYGGGYLLQGGSMTFAPMAATEMACPEPRMTIEGAWLTSLGLVTGWQAEGGRVHLLDGAGNDLAVLALAAPVTAAGTWILTELGDGAGGLQQVQTDASITIVDDASLTGHSGCNTLNGEVALDGDAITVGPLATTRMACVDPGAAGIEAGLLRALDDAAGWHVDEAGQLILTDAADAVLAGFAPGSTVTGN